LFVAGTGVEGSRPLLQAGGDDGLHRSSPRKADEM